jgi:hypothetical protein
MMKMMIIIFVPFQVMEHQWNLIDRGKPKYSGKTCPSATLSTTNPTWTDPGSNLGLCSGKLADNHLRHGTALDHVTSEIHTKHVNKAELYYRFSPYHAVDTHQQGFKNESVNALWGNNSRLFQDPYKTHK